MEIWTPDLEILDEEERKGIVAATMLCNGYGRKLCEKFQECLKVGQTGYLFFEGKTIEEKMANRAWQARQTFERCKGYKLVPL